MKTIKIVFSIILLMIVLLSCSKESTTETDTTPPTLEITNPLANDQINSGEIVNITVDANDTRSVSTITFIIDDSEVFTDSESPYEYDWDTTGLSGNHTIKAKALDDAGNENTSEMIAVEIISVAGMVLIPAGNSTFQMGSENGFDDEQPVHNVTLSNDFWLSESEITQAEYDELMSELYSGYFSPSWNDTYGQGDEYPAYEVSWYDAVLYCNGKSRVEGLDSVYTYTGIIGTPGSLCELENVSSDFSKNGYRLPTEAEWEFAYRGDSTTDFYWGQDYDPYPANAADSLEFGDYTVWYGNSWIAEGSDFGTQPVKSKLPNDYDLYDMAGNVYEWCHDWYGEYSADSQNDPDGPDSGSWHTIRGGSWANHATYLRAANRTFYAPCYFYYLLGFRIARTAS